MYRILILLLILSSSAMGQIDPYPDSIGIYFDEGATINSQYATAPTTVHAYLIATRISSSGIDSWCGGVHCTVPIYSTTRGDGVNSYNNVTYFDQRFDVTFSTPLSSSSTIVLADLYIPTSNEQAINLYLSLLEGHEDSYYYSSGGATIYLQPSVPCINIPCYPAWVASINWEGPVTSDTISWGEIKSLFR